MFSVPHTSSPWWVTSAAGDDPLATISVNGGSMRSPVALSLNTVTTVSITVGVAGQASTTYRLAIRRLPQAALAAGKLFNCILYGGNVACWGVRKFWLCKHTLH